MGYCTNIVIVFLVLNLKCIVAPSVAEVFQPDVPFVQEFMRNDLLFTNGCSCQNNATCDSNDCICSNFYSGDLCEIDPSCLINNGQGQCINGICENFLIDNDNKNVGEQCNCGNGWTGALCNEESSCFDSSLHPYWPNVCNGTGTCIKWGTSSEYSCDCFEHYYGNNCEYFSEACSDLPNGDARCGLHGYCHVSRTNPNNYSCACEDGWKGSACDEPDMPVVTMEPPIEPTGALSPGEIAGIVIGSVASIGIIVVLYKFCYIPKISNSYNLRLD